MKVLLAYRAPDDVADDPSAAALPAGLAWLAERVRADGHAPVLANFSRLPWKQVERYLVDAAPALVGISCLTFNRHSAVRLARVARRACPGATVLVGGPHASALPDLLLGRVREIDAVVLGEGEEALAAACRCVESAAQLAGPGLATRGGTNLAPVLPDPRRLPAPSPGLEGAGLEPERDLRHVLASRGRDEGALRRSAESVITECAGLRDEFGLIDFALEGPGLADPRWLAEFAEELAHRKVAVLSEFTAQPEELAQHGPGDLLERALFAARSAGLRRVHFVLDDDRAAAIPAAVLADASGLLRAAGVASHLTLRIGGLGESLGASWLASMRSVVRALRPLSGSIEARELLPGTDDWRLAAEDEGLDDTYWMDEDRAVVPLASESAVERGRAALEVVFREVAREAQPGPRDLDALEARGAKAWTHLDWGDYRAAHGDAEEAERRFRLAAQLEPWSPFPWLRMASLFGRRRGDVTRETAALKQVLHLVPRHQPTRDRLDEIRRDAERGRARGVRRKRSGS